MSAPEPSTPAEQRQRALRQTSEFNVREWLFRIGICLAIVGSVFLAWWSLTRMLLPRQKQSREILANVDHLSSEVFRLDRKWTRADEEQINQKFNQARAELFASNAALEDWFGELETQATSLGLDLQADFGKPAATNNLNLIVIPATISIQVRPLPPIEGAPSPYQRVLQFSHKLTTGEKRADLMEMTVKGGANSVYEAKFVVNLWTGGEEAK